ncbi:hypothetical protein QFC20_002917 [Naganishia adeliensis]|uniref:Uncharacterized protein n=1 Tax=Naganishia adeliensis TaxID=92952 RepID=A0ACC2WG05_9TREE|nr:hypothetical protein QFC20_002917 [Naganishia adeliensis]
MIYTGSCYCREITFEGEIDDPANARTSICHCKNCKKFFGGPYGTTTKFPTSGFRITSTSQPRVHEADNGSGSLLHREFCGTCGGPILEYGKAAEGKFVYVMYGAWNEQGRKDMPPRGEFFTKVREDWLEPLPGLFQKREIKE